jgi:Ankyrin repeats (3 copies)
MFKTFEAKTSVGAARADGHVAESGKKKNTSMTTPNKLFNHLAAGNWELALDRLARKPTDIQERYLFLHKALQNKAPLHVVKALHEARPDAVYTQEPNFKMMALHVACQRGLPAQVVRYLHEMYPDSVKHACHGNMLPLHLASTCHDCQVQVFNYLLSVYPQAIEVKDSKGMAAIDYIEQRVHPDADILLRELERGYHFWSARDLYDPSGCQLSLLLRERKWDAAMERLLNFPEESTIWSVYKEKRYLPVHYACKFSAPVTVVSELAELHPYGLALTCQDDDMTALHLACQTGASYGVVQALLDHHDDAASHRDDIGLLPLHRACANACPIAVIDALLRAYPQGASTRDAKGNIPLVYVESSEMNPDAPAIHKLLTTDFN